MDTIKNALGLSGSEQSGQEPVSGQGGQGTVNQPYDQGNVEGAFNHYKRLVVCGATRVLPLAVLRVLRVNVYLYPKEVYEYHPLHGLNAMIPF